MLKFKNLAVAVASVMLSLSAMAAGAAADPDAWEKFKTYTHAQKAEAVAQGKKAMAEIDQKIADMQKQVKQAGADTKAANAANMKELQEKKKVVKAELNKLEKSSSNAWDATKEGFSNAFKDLGTAYDKAVAGGKS